MSVSPLLPSFPPSVMGSVLNDLMLDCSALGAGASGALYYRFPRNSNKLQLSFPHLIRTSHRFKSFSATSSLMVEVEERPKFDGDTAALLVKELRKSFDSGRTRSYEWRVSQLKSIEKMIEENEKEISKALHKDLSKPELESFLSEVDNELG